MTVRQWLGAYQAVVVRNDDPTGQQRVTLRIPQVLGTAVSQWAAPISATGSATPVPGSSVVVMFLGGDINHPVYLVVVDVSNEILTSSTFTKAVTLATITTVNHNLGIYPQVSVLDGSGNVVAANIQHTNVNTVVVTFSASFSGTVVCTV
jgi:phage gp45-like